MKPILLNQTIELNADDLAAALSAEEAAEVFDKAANRLGEQDWRMRRAFAADIAANLSETGLRLLMEVVALAAVESRNRNLV